VTTAVTKTVWPDKQVELSEKPRFPVAGDLVAHLVKDRHLPFNDRDEGVQPVAMRYSTSPTLAARSFPSAASIASCDSDNFGLAGVGTRRA
jgi:hypothetical protein